MGNEESHMVDESTPPQTLRARTAEGVAHYIRYGRVHRIVVMTGAGLSTSAGIPDFRSPETGLYANLQRLNLPRAEAVFDISFFRQNPLPFYALAHELYPGRYRPTIAHSFIRLLHDKGMLSKLFTQNIDCLEREAGVPDDSIVEAHGSFATQRCIECKTEYPEDRMREVVRNKEVPRCLVEGCNGIVKPDIVFFGEALPEKFFDNRHLPGEADLVIVMGTSLTVQPFASLPQFAGEGVPRVLINKELVGDLGSRADDVLMLGDCDDGVRQLANWIGWQDELEALWATTAPKEAQGLPKSHKEAETSKTKDEALEDKIEKLAQEVDESLKLSKEHTDRVKAGLVEADEKGAKSQKKSAVAGGDLQAQMKAHEEPKEHKEPPLPEKTKLEPGEEASKEPHTISELKENNNDSNSSDLEKHAHEEKPSL